jgi:hypothetical protein
MFLISCLVVSCGAWVILHFHPVTQKAWGEFRFSNGAVVTVPSGGTVVTPSGEHLIGLRLYTVVTQTEALFPRMLVSSVYMPPFKIRSAALLHVYVLAPGQKAESPALQCRYVSWEATETSVSADIPLDMGSSLLNDVSISGQVCLSYLPLTHLLPAGLWAPKAPKTTFLFFLKGLPEGPELRIKGATDDGPGYAHSKPRPQRRPTPHRSAAQYENEPAET